MFIAFIIARTWTQHNYPSAGVDKDVIHMANGILIIERNEIASFVGMDGLTDCHTE